MQVRIEDEILVKQLKRLAFDRDTSVPAEVTRLLKSVFEIQRKVKRWQREKAQRQSK